MKSKIQQVTGERIGQLIANAIRKYEIKSRLDPESENAFIGAKLSFINDEYLIHIVKDYLARHKTKESIEEK
jgi:hypothetical protein